MPAPARPAAPPPLLVAASVAALEGLVFCGYAVLEVASTGQGRVAMGVTTAVFFAGYGAGLLLCGWRLARLSSWARSPVVLAQLIHLGLAWSFWGAETRAVSVVLAVVALVVLAGLFHPASIEALADEPGGA